MLKKLGLPFQIGQTIELEYEVNDESYEKEFVLSGFCEGDPQAMAQQCFVSKEFQESIAPTPDEAYYESDTGYLSGYYNIHFNFNHRLNLEKKTRDLLERNGYDIDDIEYSVNWAYSYDRIEKKTVIFLGVILVLIFLAGYLIIRNIFKINVASDIREYGLLKTIGTTRKQIKRIIHIQALLLTLFAIPIGLLGGTIVAKVLFPWIVSGFNYEKMDVTFLIHPIIYLSSSVLSLITVLLGCSKPGRIASKVSPMEALKYMRALNIKRKKTKVVSPYSMALTNLRREKWKVFFVGLSLTLTLFLTNCVYTIITSFDGDKYVGHQVLGDFSIQDQAMIKSGMIAGESDVVEEKDLDYLGHLDGVNGQSNIYHQECVVVNLSNHARHKLEELKQVAEKDEEADSYGIELIDLFLEQNSMDCELFGFDEWALSQIIDYEGELDWEKFKTGNYAIAQFVHRIRLDD